MTPRDELELNTLERTGDPELAAYIGGVVQRLIEDEAELLERVMGVPAEMLMPLLWEEVDAR